MSMLPLPRELRRTMERHQRRGVVYTAVNFSLCGCIVFGAIFWYPLCSFGLAGYIYPC